MQAAEHGRPDQLPAGEERVGELGGDPACWAHRLCPACGRIPDRPGACCDRCGAALGDDE